MHHMYAWLELEIPRLLERYQRELDHPPAKTGRSSGRRKT
jgi:hypothetical protein